MKNPVIFVSYSHKDEQWRERIVDHLGCLTTKSNIETWTDKKIQIGNNWYQEIKDKLNQADVLLCLISRHFLKSDFCIKEEVNYLIENRQKKLIIYSILISPCYWKIYDWIGETQMQKFDNTSLVHLNNVEQDQHISEVVEDIHQQLNTQETNEQHIQRIWKLAIHEGEEFLDKDQTFVGCKEQIAQLDREFKEGQNVITIIGDGGVGKSALVRHWIQKLNDNPKDNVIKEVYVWSFYQQGTKEQSFSVDQFFATALEKLDIGVSKSSSTQYKAERLAETIQEKKLLLLLDGVETLQYPSTNYAHKPGNNFDNSFKNPAFTEFISKLSEQNEGLCIITSRQSLPINLAPPEYEIKLDRLATGATRAILRIADFKGSDDELVALANRLEGHALAIKLLATNLDSFGPKYEQVLTELKKATVHAHIAKQLIFLLYRKLTKPQQQAILLLGLFDRPIEIPLISKLMANNTNNTNNTRTNNKDTNIKQLIKMGLIENISIDNKPHIDCHPLTREFFYQEAKNSKTFWQEKNQLAYEDYEVKLKENPATYQDIIHLILAIRHGIEGKAKTENSNLSAIFNLYKNKANKDSQSQIINAFGSLELDLACLSYFFEKDESDNIIYEKIKSGLTENEQSLIYSWTAYALQGLGKLKKAEEPMKKAYNLRLNSANKENKKEQHKDTAASADNLVALYITKGRLIKAQQYANDGQKIIALGIIRCNDHKSCFDYDRAYNKATHANIYFYQNDLNKTKNLLLEAEKLHNEASKNETKDLLLKAEKPHNETTKNGSYTNIPATLVGHYGFYYCQYLLHELATNTENDQIAKSLENLLTRAKAIEDNPEPTQESLHLALAYLTRANAYYIVSDLNKAASNINTALEHIQKAGFSFYKCLALIVKAKTCTKQKQFGMAWRALDEVFTAANHDMKLIMIEYYIACSELLKTLMLTESTTQPVIIESHKEDLHINKLHTTLKQQIEKIKPLINQTGAQLYQASYKELKSFIDSQI